MDGLSFNSSIEDSLGSPVAGYTSSSTGGSAGDKSKRAKLKSNQQVHLHDYVIVHVRTCTCMCEFNYLL